MKKLILFFALLMGFAFFPLFGQEVPVIPDWEYLYGNFGTLMATFLGVAAIASFVGEILIRLFKMTKKLWKVIVIMILGVGISSLGNLINVGYLAASPWWQTGLWGLLSGVAACGLKSGNILFFKTIVEFIIGLVLSKETKPE